jgi:acyl carrier protein
MDRASAYEQFRATVVDVLDVDPEIVTPEARFKEDFEADSLAVVELILAVEGAFSIRIPESEAEGIETAGQAFELVATKLSL